MKTTVNFILKIMNKTNNSRTIDSYNAHFQEYMDGTPREVSGYVKDWLGHTIADVLEVSGFKDIIISNRVGNRNTGWLQIIAKKTEL